MPGEGREKCMKIWVKQHCKGGVRMLGPCCAVLARLVHGHREGEPCSLPTCCVVHTALILTHGMFPLSVQLYGFGQQKRHNIYQYLINTSVKMAIFVLYVGSSIGSLEKTRNLWYFSLIL